MKNAFLIFFFLSIILPAISTADDLQVDIHFCFGNSQKLLLEGRVIEKRENSPANESDGMFANFWRTMRLLVNDEETATKVDLSFNNQYLTGHTDDEGYFSFKVPLKYSPEIKQLTVLLQTEGLKLETECVLFLSQPKIRVGIISDFDDTVVVSDVTDKTRLIVNVLTKNYKQREAVTGMAEYYKELLSSNSAQDSIPLFFVTGSPRQIQPVINRFLDYHHFQPRVVITKKLNGDNSDPLFDQLKYKAEKIEIILSLLPDVSFYLIGDDGEKDPEVYREIQKLYPERVKEVWIRQVSKDVQRKRYSGQHLFVEK